MCKTWVKRARNQRQTCERLSTNPVAIEQTMQHHVDNQHIIHDTTPNKSTAFSTGIVSLPPLSEYNLYPVSTAPIITNY